MHRVIVVGSPRADGRSAHLADELFNACIEECPEDGVSIVSVASIEVGPCRACDACKQATEAPEALPEDDDNLAIMPLVAESDAVLHRCVIHDDMTEVRKHLDAADELIVVAPVYFAGPPAQFKCLLDRLQPYFWSDVRTRGKRPCVLHVVGEGGDPHGFEPLIGCVRSAFACAGFQLELVLDWVGKITEDGEITGDAEEYVVELGDVQDYAYELDEYTAGVDDADASAAEESKEPAPKKSASAEKAPDQRAKLSLAEAKPSKGGGSSKGGQRGDAAQGKGAKKGSSARGGSHAGGKGSSSSKRGSGSKGKASYGKNAQGKGKRRG